MDITQLQKYDSEKMYQIYDNWPSIARKSFETKQDPIIVEGIDHIVFAGMGGSGTIGDVFASILSKSKIHVNVVKGYALPETVDENTLVVIISVSGNTNETLTILDTAYQRKSKIIAFSENGEMIEFCKRNHIQHRIVPQYHSPRASFTSYLYSILQVLHSTLGIKKDDILKSAEELENMSKKISSRNLTNSNPSLELAKWITSIPMIYYPFGLQSACIRFKNSLNENSKMHVFTEDVIEACHNGIVAWEKTSEVKPVLIQGKDDHEKTKERWEILEKFFQQNDIPYKKILSVEGNILTKLINLIYLFDYATIYKAVIDGINPSSVKSINFIKSEIKSNKFLS